MASEVKMGLECLPDVAIISIFAHLPLNDIINVSKTNRRLAQLCTEKSIARFCDFEGKYLLGDDDVKHYISASKRNVEKLVFNHCHWFLPRTIQWTIQNCQNIQALHVIECRLRTEALVNLIANLPKLTALSFSISTFADVKKEMFTPAQFTLKNLSRLHLYYTSTELVFMRYHGECPTILDYCDNLEELVIDSAGMAVPELYLPVISNPSVYTKLTKLCLTPNVHAGAQMFFYGTLQELPNANLRWHTLLMPNVNFSEFSKKKELMNCLKQIENLENLDLSCSRVDLPNPLVDFTRARNLKYLNLKSKFQPYTEDELKVILNNCTQLTSLNLAGCTWNFESNGRKFKGLEMVFQQCQHLRHLNISGLHQHCHEDSPKLLAKFKDLRSLALSVCMLCPKNPSTSRPGKREPSSPPWRPSNVKRMRLSQCYGASAVARSSGTSSSSASSSSLLSASPSPSTSSSSGEAAVPSPPVALSCLVEASPRLTELELLSVGFDSAIRRNKFINPKVPQFQPCTETRLVRDADLEPLGRLKHLRRLTLAGIPGLTSSSSLVSITQGCRSLEFLSLAYIGSSSFSSSLCRALAYCENLKDFRLEQPHMSLNKAFFEALTKCRKLERICLLTKHSVFQPSDVLRMVEQISSLVVLQLFADGTIVACRNLTNLLNRRFSKSRPGMSITMFPLMYEGIAEIVTSIPAKHTEELTRFDTHVSSKPPS